LAILLLTPPQLGDIGCTASYSSPFGEAGRGKKWEGQKTGGANIRWMLWVDLSRMKQNQKQNLN